MRTLTDQLANYAAYHRDTRNIATHFAGIPMIVVAVTILLSRPELPIPGLLIDLTPALVLTVVVAVFYLRLDLRLGLVMAVLLGASLALSHWIAARSTGLWLGAGFGLFVVGWIFQFVGHIYEGRKPAFVDDLIGLLIGPLFVVAEVAFAFGLRRELLRDIEARVGPTHHGRVTKAA